MLLSRASIRACSSPWSKLLISHRVGQHRSCAAKSGGKGSPVPVPVVVGGLGLVVTVAAYTQRESIKELIFGAPKPSTPAAPKVVPMPPKPKEEKPVKAKVAAPAQPPAAKASVTEAKDEKPALTTREPEQEDPEKARILKALGDAESASKAVLCELIAAANAVGVKGPPLDVAMAQLTRLQEAEKKAAAITKASSALQDAVAGESMEALRAAIHQAAGLIGNDEETLQTAASKLLLLEQRDACRKELRAAAGAADPKRCAAALEEGSKLGLTLSVEYQLAEVAMEPRRLCDALVKDDSVLFSKEAKSAFTVEEFASAEKQAIEDLSEEQLRERLLERSRALALSRHYHTMRMEEALTTFRESSDAGYKMKLDTALHTLEENLAKKSKSEREALEGSMQEQHKQILQDAIAKAEVDAAEVSETRLTQLKGQAMAELESERGLHLNAVRSLRGMLEATENALSRGDNLKRRAHANTQLSAALLSLEGALQAGRCPAKEFDHLKAVAKEADAFAAAILEKLPGPCLELTRKRIPTESRLQRSFQDRLGNLIAAAFMPQDSEKTLFSAITGNLVARVFQAFYYLERDPNAVPHVAPDGDKPTDIEQNLAALSRAAYQVEQGELVKAIAIIEGSLVGKCRQGAIDWVTEAKLAMTLRQVMTALKAQAQCLNYSLIGH